MQLAAFSLAFLACAHATSDGKWWTPLKKTWRRFGLKKHHSEENHPDRSPANWHKDEVPDTFQLDVLPEAILADDTVRLLHGLVFKRNDASWSAGTSDGHEYQMNTGGTHYEILLKSGNKIKLPTNPTHTVAGKTQPRPFVLQNSEGYSILADWHFTKPGNDNPCSENRTPKGIRMRDQFFKTEKVVIIMHYGRFKGEVVDVKNVGCLNLSCPGPSYPHKKTSWRSLSPSPLSFCPNGYQNLLR